MPSLLQIWGEVNGVSFATARRIRTMSNRIAKLGERECNEGTLAVQPELDEAHAAFDKFIKRHGFFSYYMPGLYPVLRKNGHDVHLPD